MKAKPMKQTRTGQIPCEPNEATHVWLNMPGPLPNRCVPVILGNKTRKGANCWSWNGDVDKPTLKPSFKTKGKDQLTDEEIDRILSGEKVEKMSVVCHTWVTDGKAIFLNDCTHELAGQTLDLLEVDL